MSRQPVAIGTIRRSDIEALRLIDEQTCKGLLYFIPYDGETQGINLKTA